MSQAAILFHPDMVPHGSRLTGRHAAGESFLRGYIRNAVAEPLWFWNGTDAPDAEVEAQVRRIEPPTRPIAWIGRRERSSLERPGALHLPDLGLAEQAWLRAPLGSQRYSITAITHTISTRGAAQSLAAMLTAPADPWDGLICTSRAARAAVEALHEAVREDLRERLGATRFAAPQLCVIPLGINVADFRTGPEQRAAWRARLNIPEADAVALYVGRLNIMDKMNPAPMAMALEAAAKSTGAPLHWVVAGWTEEESRFQVFADNLRRLCPSVNYIQLDGRPEEVRRSLWAVADLFVSMPENVQETFGITPVEAMAAGLPCVVTDWDGYRDTVRHGVDGFRIATSAPRPGLAADLAEAYADGTLGHSSYSGAAAHMCAIDLRAATEALVALIGDRDLRRRMGDAGRERARTTFDWAAIVPQYEALWDELAARRRAAGPGPGPMRRDPRALDPYAYFQSYPTEVVGPDHRVLPVEGVDVARARAVAAEPLAGMLRAHLPTGPEIVAVLEALAARGEASVGQLAALAGPERAALLERGIGWMAKFGLVRIALTRPVETDS